MRIVWCIFLMGISNHCHKKRKRPKEVFFNSCSVTIIKIFLKIFVKENYDLTTLIITSDDSCLKHRINTFQKIVCCRILTCGYFRSCFKLCLQNFHFFKNWPGTPKWKALLTIKIRKKIHRSDFGVYQFLFLKYMEI